MNRQQHFGLLELGSNSLKFYLVAGAPLRGYTIETHKFPWRVAYDFFSCGVLKEETVQEIIATLRRILTLAAGLRLSGTLSLATGVFREFPDLKRLGDRLRQETGVRLRVVSGKDEARLLVNGFRTTEKGSIVLVDVGGGSTEWACIEDGRAKESGSLRLGAIRNHCVLRNGIDPATYVKRNREFCDEELAKLPVAANSKLLVTGGTASALAGWRKKNVVSFEKLRQGIEEVRTNGLPECVEPHRREAFLAGLIILERLMVRFRAAALEYGHTSVRHGLASRLVDLLESRAASGLHTTLLLSRSGTG